MYGTTAKILRVNLTDGKIETKTLSEDFYRLYPGGKALAGYILLNELPPHTEPFAPENVLIFANGDQIILCNQTEFSQRRGECNFRVQTSETSRTLEV